MPSHRSIDLGHVTVDRFADLAGREPDELYRFVRDYVRFEPYDGALRGPRGALISLAGNSLDQSLLLQSLLAEAGLNARIVRGVLPEHDATRLAQELFSWKSRAAADEGTRTSSRDRWLTRRRRRRIATFADRILASIDTRPASSTSPRTSVSELANEARDHFWVQCQATGAAWIDLDPTCTNSQFGRTAGRSGTVVGDPEQALAHRVVLQIRIQQVSDGKPVTRTIYRWSGTSAQLGGEAFVIQHAAPPKTAAGSTVAAAASFAGALADGLQSKTTSTHPIIKVLGRTEKGETFRLNRPQSKEVRPKLPPGFGRFGFGGDAAKAAGPRTVREWVEIQVTDPSGKTNHVERTLHDEKELEHSDMLRGRVTVVSVSSGVPHWFHYPRNKQQPPLREGDRHLWRLLRAINLMLIADPGQRAGGFAIPGKGFVRYIVDQPQVIISDASAVEGKTQFRGDLRFMSQRTISTFQLTADELVRFRVMRGVIDTQCESDLFAVLSQEAPSSEPTAMRILRRSHSLTPLNVVDLKQLPVKAHVREHARRQLEAGSLLIGSRQPVSWAGRDRAAWWLVNPRNGTTIGVMDTGLHQTGFEQPAVQSTQSNANTEAAAMEAAAVGRGTVFLAYMIHRLMQIDGNLSFNPGQDPSEVPNDDSEETEDSEDEEDENQEEDEDEETDDGDTEPQEDDTAEEDDTSGKPETSEGESEGDGDAGEGGSGESDGDAGESNSDGLGEAPSEGQPPVAPGSEPAGDGESSDVSETAEDIANGHAYDKHVVNQDEFPEIDSPEDFAELIDNVIKNPSEDEAISNGRHKYWDDDTGTIVITNPNDPDGGTTFRPDRGKDYYDDVH